MITYFKDRWYKKDRIKQISNIDIKLHSDNNLYVDWSKFTALVLMSIKDNIVTMQYRDAIRETYKEIQIPIKKMSPKLTRLVYNKLKYLDYIK